METDETPSPSVAHDAAGEANPKSPAAPAKKKRAARKTAAKKSTRRRPAAAEAAVGGDAGPAEKGTPPAPARAAEPPPAAAPVKAPSLKPNVPEQVPMSFSADPNDEPERPPSLELTDEVAAPPSPPRAQSPERSSDRGGRSENGQESRDRPRRRDSRGARGRDRDRDGGQQSAQHGGDQRGGDQRGGDQRGGDQRGGGSHGGHHSSGPGRATKRNKFEKKKFKKDRPPVAAGRKGRGRPRGSEDFFGSSDTFVIEVGELPNLEILRDVDKAAALAANRAGGEGGPVNLNRLFTIPLTELVALARDEFSIHLDVAPVREPLVDQILDAAYEANRPIEVSGIVETTADGYGLIVYEHDSYRVRPVNAFIPRAFLKRYGIKRGTMISAQVHPKRKPLPQDALAKIRATHARLDDEQPIDALSDSVEEDIAEEVLAAMFAPTEFLQDLEGEEESCPYVLKVLSLMEKAPEENLQVTPFEDLVPYYPTERIILETEPGVKWDNMAMRVVDLLTPVGLGQRGLIVAPPRTGKTVLQQAIANAVVRNSPDAHLIILLIDERPEEVTDFRRQITRGEVIASTFDESPENHVHCAEMVIEKARRMVEDGRDVIILLDSITRLARAYNALAGSSGKILSGGVEANALQKPKRFFGSARNIEDGGSLTIIGTALVETGSRMDEVIFEEFKGTGNMELHLDRQLSDKRIFPAIEMAKSGTRKEELLYHKDEMLKVYGLRRAMKGVPPIDAMEMLITRIKKTPNNLQFLLGISS